MFAPNITTYQLADQIHLERQTHAARINQITRDRSTDSVIVDRPVQRRITSRRLAATLVAATLTFAVAAAAAANSPSTTAPQGGGVTLIR